MAAAAKTILDKHKRVDILVNNAGTVDHANDGVLSYQVKLDLVR